MASASSVDGFEDPEAYCARVHNSRVRVLPQSVGAFSARLTLVQLEGVNLAMGEEVLPRIFRSEPALGRIYFRLRQGDEPPCLFDGREESVGSVRVKQRGECVAERTAGPALMRSLSIPARDLAARVATLLGRELSDVLGDAERLHPAPETFARLAALQADALRLAHEAPAVLAHPVAAAALDSRIGEALVEMIAGAAAVPDSASRRRGHAIMQRVHAFIEAQGPQPITLSEICAAGGCSAKTLELLFLERLGQTPNRYLRRRRLWAAHRALRAAPPGSTTVTDVALSCGFWELGRFAAAYRAAFDQSPSATLRSLPSEGASRLHTISA